MKLRQLMRSRLRYCLNTCLTIGPNDVVLPIYVGDLGALKRRVPKSFHNHIYVLHHFKQVFCNYRIIMCLQEKGYHVFDLQLLKIVNDK